ncbi:hypothetical protein CASFOL_040248 [Castilleja foliolosa]|uniref:Uncharacterized protein n=1 Tax=Castilleja foliolosa TaxID=1961234 RepID=A0ABD3BFC0_9LAMI
MSYELCIPKYDLILLCSSIFSNPLYISYFIFFSPFLFRLINYLSPLLFTSFLISFTLVTAIDSAFTSPVQEKDFQDDLGIYETLFGTCSNNCLNEENPLETPHEKSEENPEPGLDDKDSSFCNKNEATEMEEKNPGPVTIVERRLDNFLKILDQFEKMSTKNVEEERKNGGGVDKAGVGPGVRQNAATKIDKAHSQRIIRSNNIEKDHNLEFESFRTWDHNSESFGSMRKEKEWKRTLACKLFEERHNVDGSEGMDSLWEAYETDSNKSKCEIGEKKNRGKKTRETEFSEELCGDEVVDGQLCCLNAIKFSAGKVNLGMGKPNIVKISKAIKGFGWLHHVSKYIKKVHNNGDR